MPDPREGAVLDAALFEAVRRKMPIVHCITNYVAMNYAANLTLAVGASPAMVHAVEEVEEFAGIADTLTVNIGTLSRDWLAAMLKAAAAARAMGKPWVLDPVAHQATGFRREAVKALLAQRPAIIRGNASEILALDERDSRGKGIDSRDGVDEAVDSAIALARRHGAVVAVTGPVDVVTDGDSSLRFHGGSALMPQVTAMGCAQTCVMGALLAVSAGEPLRAAAAALGLFKQAGERAGRAADGPGSFAYRFIDEVHRQSGAGAAA